MKEHVYLEHFHQSKHKSLTNSTSPKVPTRKVPTGLHFLIVCIGV